MRKHIRRRYGNGTLRMRQNEYLTGNLSDKCGHIVQTWAGHQPIENGHNFRRGLPEAALLARQRQVFRMHADHGSDAVRFSVPCVTICL